MKPHPSEAARLINLLAQRRDLDPETRLACNVWLDAHRKAARAAAPQRVLFDPLLVPGYVMLGEPERPHSKPLPKAQGLEDAHTVFLQGVGVSNVLSAAEFDVTPNALRGRFETAAQWADEAGSPALGRCIRAIGVTKAGAITYERPVDVELVLAMC